MSRFPSLKSLLIQGNDQRLTLDEQGNNAYFCQPKVNPKLLRLGSSTASSISAEQWQLAKNIHASMKQASQHTQMHDVQHQQTDMVVQGLRDACHLPQNTHIQLADSGTDAHLLAMQYFYNKKPKAVWHVIMVDASETGRGVPQALQLEGTSIRCENIPIRQASGDPLSPHIIDNSIKHAVKSGIQQGWEVVLLLVDVSKTGCIAPSLDIALQLRQQHPKQLHLLLDACQFRLGYETLNHYLQHDIPIAITGSKFLAAPSFCAALLVPHHIQKMQTPQALGVLLRWQLALHHLQALNQLPAHACATFTKNFATQINHVLQHHDAFLRLPTPVIQRQNQPEKHWQNHPTIFPFSLKTKQGLVSHQQALRLFKNLQCDVDNPIQLGRPMPLHAHPSIESIGIFRLCVSAPMMVDAIIQHEQKSIIQQAIDSLQHCYSLSLS
ncbi:MAG: hypothetical protein Q9M15_04415 [Mariprofundaceae bacterium]|nr:hypothetical protein [Mariprofundaceae bacterium]